MLTHDGISTSSSDCAASPGIVISVRVLVRGSSHGYEFETSQRMGAVSEDEGDSFTLGPERRRGWLLSRFFQVAIFKADNGHVIESQTS